jgi:hydroxyethylthiazole kinase-like uncharacterized protein yjeF
MLAGHTLPLDPLQPELMLREADDTVEMPQLTCLVVGPGLGQSPPARSAVARALERSLPLLLDADALNLIGAHDALREVCNGRTAPTLLTPHPAEAARLLRTSTAEVQRDRIASASSLARRYRAAVALKGVGTVIALPSGTWYVNTTGNPGLASAGMGDVLSGMVGALLAQGLRAEDALLAGIHLHGLAADAQLRQAGGPIGMTGAEVIASARHIANRAVYANAEQGQEPN